MEKHISVLLEESISSLNIQETSTIVDCTKDEIKVLREGPVTIEQIKNVL